MIVGAKRGLSTLVVVGLLPALAAAFLAPVAPRGALSTGRSSVAMRSQSWPVIDVAAIPWDRQWLREYEEEMYEEEDRQSQVGFIPPSEQKIGVIVVDHGSRRPEANKLLEKIVEDYKGVSGFDLVEPAHMELAEPSIAAAFGKCVEQGATFIICHPFFLARGKHVQDDIPTLMEEAASIFPGVEWAISEPLGVQSQIPLIMQAAVNDCIKEKGIVLEA